MKKLEIKAVVKARDFALTPQELAGMISRSCPGGRLPGVYEALASQDRALAQEWADMVSACSLVAHCNGIRRGVEIAAGALPEAQDPDLKLSLEVLVQ